VKNFHQMRDCTPEQLRQATVGYHLHDLAGYWQALPSSFFAVVVYLEDEQWLDQVVFPTARSRGESWIVLNTPEQEADWLQPLVG
jgi:hypothetical protein